MSSRFSSNSEANASELLGNLEEIVESEAWINDDRIFLPCKKTFSDIKIPNGVVRLRIFNESCNV